MSWYRGSQLTTVASSFVLHAAWITAWVDRIVLWLTMTPLGIEVEPDVYCRKAREDLSTSGFFQLSASESSMLRGLIQCTFCTAGSFSASFAALLIGSGMAKAIHASASAARLKNQDASLRSRP